MRKLHFLPFFVLPCFLACQQAQEQDLFAFSSTTGTEKGKAEAKSVAADIVFKSTDGGQTWQDISAGLPLDTRAVEFFAVEGELLLTANNGTYRSKTASQTVNWEKEIHLQKPIINVSSCPTGTMAVTEHSRFFQKLKGTDVWMPIFTDFTGHFMRNVFTAKDGSTFIGTDDGIFKSADQGKTWKNVMQGGWMIKMVESNDVLVCTSQSGILRSTDGGEHWEVVVSKGGVGIDVSIIKDGFAAIVYEHGSETRRILTSTDGGKHWQAIDAGLPPSKLISTIVQMGDSFYCGHPEGIYRSVDGGRSWYMTVPTIGKKVFNLSVSEGMMYAVLREGGC